MANTVSRILSNDTLNRIIQIESAGRPNAKAPTSSALGLGQFLDATWLATVKAHRPDWLAGTSRAAVLAMRLKPERSIEMLARFTEDNAHALGAGFTDGDLYLAHFAGAGVARKVMHAPPSAPASNYFDANAIRANRSILQGRTAGQVRAWAAKRMAQSGGHDWIGKYWVAAPVTPADNADEIPEDAALVHSEATLPPPPPPPPDEPAPVAADTMQGDPELWHVQRRLKAMNYNPGGTDGKWGGMTAGAIGGFMNDREMADGAPTSLEMFNAMREDLKAEIAKAESEGFTRPISVTRANADQATVAAKAPEVVPVKRNFLAAAWTSASVFFIGIWNAISGYVSDAWSFFTDHKDDLPEGAASSIWDWFGQVPGYVWLILVAAGLGFIAWNSHKGIQRITQSVQSGERQ